MLNPVPGTVFPTATIEDLATSIAPFINNDQVHRNLPCSPAVAQYFTANVSQLNSLTSKSSFFLLPTQNDSLPAHDTYAAQQLTFLIYNAIRTQLGTDSNGQYHLPKFATPASLPRFFGLRHFKYNNNNSPTSKRNKNRSTARYIIVGSHSGCNKGSLIESKIHSFLLVNKNWHSPTPTLRHLPGRSAHVCTSFWQW